MFPEVCKLLALLSVFVTILSDASDHQTLRAVPPGPYATDLTEAVQAYNQVWASWMYTSHVKAQSANRQA